MIRFLRLSLNLPTFVQELLFISYGIIHAFFGMSCLALFLIFTTMLILFEIIIIK